EGDSIREVIHLLRNDGPECGWVAYFVLNDDEHGVLRVERQAAGGLLQQGRPDMRTGSATDLSSQFICAALARAIRLTRRSPFAVSFSGSSSVAGTHSIRCFAFRRRTSARHSSVPAWRSSGSSARVESGQSLESP